MQLDDSFARLRVQLHTLVRGPIELAAVPEHRLMIHAGGPVRVTCHAAQLTYTRGHIDLVPAGYADAWHHHEDSRSLVLQLAPELVQSAAAELGHDPDRTQLDARHQFNDPQIEHIAWALEADREEGSPAGRLYRDSLGLALALHLLGHFPTARNPRRGLPEQQLLRVKDYIEVHLDRDLSLHKLASIAELSASHLKRAFRRSTGVPVHAYVVRRRVERAKRLLLDGELPASEVALEAGFAHQSHMARCMRRVLGISPSALRLDAVAGPRT